jgi:cytochrome c oxidase subunit 2
MRIFLAERVGHLAEEVDANFLFIFLVVLFFFVITQGALLWFAVRYRRRRGEKEPETPHITGNRLLETAWVVIPSLLILAIFIFGYRVFRDIRTPPPGAAEVNVTASQFLYTFTYPNGRTAINEVRVPVGAPVKFLMTSRDVIHGFYLPEFRVKQDILPGRYTDLWLEPDRPGRYDIFCTQYCGTGHSTMRAVMVVMEKEAYREWAAGKEEEEGVPLAQRGKELVAKSGCTPCHSLDGTTKIGPTFKGLYGRTTLLTDGTSVVADENYLRESILEPNAKVVKGFKPIMPTFKGILKDDDIAAIIVYLKSLK